MLWFIKTKRRRVFDAGGASLEGSALHGVVFDRYARPQPPSGFYFQREIAELNLLTQSEQFVCEPDSGVTAATFIEEKTNRDLRPIHDVEGVYDIVESKAHSLTG